ncbi:MAG: Ig-like domain-containing protein [Burkholderiales bacterium]|nr:Ig-like domain-containing protein [Burkholderiales bacterium]
MNIHKHAFSFFLLLLAFALIGTSTQPAYAASQREVTLPHIDRFYIDSPDRLTPGSDLTFTVEGTPQGKASVRINRVKKNIPLKEVSRGVYEGVYTIKSKDKITGGTTLRVTLQERGQSTYETYRMASASSTAPAAQPAAMKIDRFTVTPIGKIEPGAELRFALHGTPGAKAYFTIEGITANVPMREVSSGQYEGSYTIRRLDHFPSAVKIYGTLEANGQAIGAPLKQALITDTKPPVLGNISPRDGETVVAGTVTSVSATFDDSGGVGVDTKSARVVVGGANVTQSSVITPQFFTYRANLPPGRYPVEVTARDLAGNAVRQVWTFNVVQQAAATHLPLRILNHANNDQVRGDITEVRGRTAADAKVDVQVQGISSVAGLFGVTQQIYSQSLRADANGDFVFSFRPQFPVAGTRYEITVNATKSDLNTELKMVLFQQQ